LTTAYNIAQAQIDNESTKKPYKQSWTSYISTLVSTNTTSLPASPPIRVKTDDFTSDGERFIPNGVLRANVIKAESCLLTGMLQMIQESVVGYIKCGLNLRKGKIKNKVIYLHI
jgi:uracil phosphoribosyltransferase